MPVKTKPRIYAIKDKVREELEFLEQRDGVLRPEAVVEYAKNKKTELYKEFTWDNNAAGHQWRLQQARALIKTIVTIIPNREDKEVQVKTYFHFDEPENGYISMTRILSDDELKDRMLISAKRELDSFRKKYSTLSELTEVFLVIDHVLDSELEEVPA